MFLVVVWTLAVSESTVTIHSLHSPAEGAVGYFRVLLAGCLIWCWLLKDTKHTSAKSWQDHLTPLALFTQSEISLFAASKRRYEWGYCYFCLFDNSPYCRWPASVQCCGVCERALASLESSSTPRQPGSTNHIAARGAGAPPRCCDWSPGHPATRSRCRSLLTCRLTAWTS